MSLRPVFIVGTGRCGSTLLSDLLVRRPEILSLSELLVFTTDLGGRIEAVFPPGPLDGPGLWRVLSATPPRQTLMLRHDVQMPEALYRPGPGRRFDAATGIPALAAATLPHLSLDPDALLDPLQALCLPLAAAPAGETWRRLLDAWRDMAGARLWVERSGGSLRLVRRLRHAFPDARFVHIVRDGRDTALSMSRHRGFRLALIAAQLTEILGVDPFEDPDRTWAADLPDDLERYLPEHFDADAFRQEIAPPPLCGHYWSGEIITGLSELAGLGPDALLTLRYEDLLAQPTAQITALLRFLLDGADPGDVSALAARVHRPRSDWRALPQREQDALEIACRPGLAALDA